MSPIFQECSWEVSEEYFLF